MAAASVVMLTACAASREAEPASAPDPVVEIRRETIMVCPAEIAAEPPAMPEPDVSAVVEGNRAGLDYVAALASFARFLLDRLADAAKECP